MSAHAAPQVLAVCAHPDDESFGLGALLSTFVERGHEVSLICLTRGEASTLGDPGSVAGRETELECAAVVLGLHQVTLLDYPDGALSEVPFDVLTEDASVAARHKDLILTFDLGGITGHPDHVRATDVALAAAAILRIPVLGWAVGSELADALNAEFGTTFVGRSRSEIDEELHVDRTRQLRAIRCHRSQSEDNPVVWRRLELQGDVELIRRLAPGAGHSPR